MPAKQNFKKATDTSEGGKGRKHTEGGGGGCGGSGASLSPSSSPSPSSSLSVYPLKAGLIDIGVNLTDTMYMGFYNHSKVPSHAADLDAVVDRAAQMGVVGLIITGGNLKESQHAVELAIAQNKRLREKENAKAKAAGAAGAAAVTVVAKGVNTSTEEGAGGGHSDVEKPKAEEETTKEEKHHHHHHQLNDNTCNIITPHAGQLKCYATVGCHPTRSSEMKGKVGAYINSLRGIIKKHSARNAAPPNTTAAADASASASSASAVDPDACVVVAIGECGLDYDRLHFSGKEDQLVGFEAQFALADEFRLPMFLHDRNTGEDFSNIMKKHSDVLGRCGGGVVHSFTGTSAHLKDLLVVGGHNNIYIGINGCSMKTAENLEVVKQIPLNRLMLETDGPWCEIKKTHDSYPFLLNSPADLQMRKSFEIVKNEKFTMGSLVKSRYEPVQMIEVLEVVFQLRKEEAEVGNDREKLAAIVRKNTEDVFPLL